MHDEEGDDRGHCCEVDVACEIVAAEQRGQPLQLHRLPDRQAGQHDDHADLTTYNYVQKLLYAGIIVVGIVIVLSGLAIWKPVQLQWLTALFGGYDVARYVHFFCMAAIVAFMVVHVALALLVPKSLRAMIIGR